MSDAEWGPEFEPVDFSQSTLGKALKAVAEEHYDPNAPAFIVLPNSGDPEAVEAAVIAGTIANSPEFIAADRRRRTNRLLYGFDVL